MQRLLLSIVLAASATASLAAPIDDLMIATLRDDGGTVTKLLVRGVDPNVPDSQGQFALHLALREESTKALKSLLAYSALKVDQTNANGETPLMLAALKGQLDMAKQLVTRGAQVNREGWTPLHYACSGPDDGMVAWLLSQGADINARSPNGSTPLMMASRYGGITTAENLVKAGADTSLRNQLDLSAVDFAKAAGRDNLARLLSAPRP